MTAASAKKNVPLTVFSTVWDYNVANPQARMLVGIEDRNRLRGYTCAGAGLWDDLVVSGSKYTLDFLPGGAPYPGQPDRTGVVVASRWGYPPFFVLTEHVSLREAWESITDAWPSSLDAAARVLISLPVKRKF
ncbi:hypothetical protein [Amycolatopsis thailandensis]|uniref:hypothetical protein n=1 Tax=Amycolatopsis thailandensis TaxID=589330 RepID=UPI00363DADB3